VDLYHIFWECPAAERLRTVMTTRVITRVQEVIGHCQVLYMSGRLHGGKMTHPHKDTQLGLLRGLRTCRRQALGPVHVVGDDVVVHRQNERRKPPRAADLKPTY
jgi:hypothetical protein